MNYSIAVFSFNHHQNLLPYCLKTIKQHVKDYQEIVVVWDDYIREKEVDFDEIRNIVDIDFRVVKHTEIYDWPKKIGEWGWVKQQLAKMLCYSYINSDRTYIVDSDVIFTGNPQLFDHDKIYLRYDKNSAVPEDYKFFLSEYLDIKSFSDYTWVGSTCMFEHEILNKIELLCYDKNGKNLVDCVDEMLNFKKHGSLPFSEYEIYGHVCKKMFPNKFIFAERNWCYPNQETRANDPIKIMWADNDDTNLQEKYKLLTNTD